MEAETPPALRRGDAVGRALTPHLALRPSGTAAERSHADGSTVTCCVVG